MGCRVSDTDAGHSTVGWGSNCRQGGEIPHFLLAGVGDAQLHCWDGKHILYTGDGEGGECKIKAEECDCDGHCNRVTDHAGSMD